MRKIAVVMLFATIVVFAEVYQKYTVELGFEGLELVDMWGSRDCSYAPFICIGGGLYLCNVFRSALDSNVFFSVDGQEICNVGSSDFAMVFWGLSSATHTMGEVISYQFKLFNECGVFVDEPYFDPSDILEAKADSAAMYVDSLLEKENNVFYQDHCYGNEDNSACVSFSRCGMVTMYTYMYESTPVRNDKVQAEIDRQNGVDTVATERLPQSVQSNRVSKSYSVFDVNGRYVPSTCPRTLRGAPEVPAYFKVRVR